MKIGYPCINRSIPCQSGKTFRLKSFSEDRFLETVKNNLDCLRQILVFNKTHEMLFFRMPSQIVPFASHPVCTVPWQRIFKRDFAALGRFIRDEQMRISMHPDQFNVLNARDPAIVGRSREELRYHAALLDSLGLDTDAKVQVHVGGVYGDRHAGIGRFVAVYRALPPLIKRRLVIENDDRSYALDDCLAVHQATGIPIVYDSLHHRVLGNGASDAEALKRISATWRKGDGVPMVDYSRQKAGARAGMHADHSTAADFRRFLHDTMPYDFDCMLEIKDKEKSAAVAVSVARHDPRFFRS